MRFRIRTLLMLTFLLGILGMLARYYVVYPPLSFIPYSQFKLNQILSNGTPVAVCLSADMARSDSMRNRRFLSESMKLRKIDLELLDADYFKQHVLVSGLVTRHHITDLPAVIVFLPDHPEEPAVFQGLIDTPTLHNLIELTTIDTLR